MGRLHSMFVVLALVVASVVGLRASQTAVHAADLIAITAGSPYSVAEGTSSGTVEVADFTDAGNPVLLTSPNRLQSEDPNPDCTSQGLARYTVSIDWADNSTPTAGAVTCAFTGEPLAKIFSHFVVSGQHTYVDAGSFTPTVTVEDTSDDGTGSGDGASASVSEQPLDHVADTTITAAEGKVSITSFFLDENVADLNPSTFDSDLAATIDWGDGSATTQATVASPGEVDCGGCDVMVTASHTYDARSDPYAITVTLAEDEQTATNKISATITDATLTAGDKVNLSESAARAFTATLASFTDKAGSQAATPDFTAKINWGDGTTSNGNVTQTATGKFSVSGTHTYARVGTMTVTVVVTDEEGSNLTLTADIGVCCLPVTGQRQPAAPSSPAMLLTFGVGLWFLGSFLRRRLLV